VECCTVFFTYVHYKIRTTILCCVVHTELSLHMINVFHWTGMFICNTSQSRYRRRNVTKSCVKNIVPQQCYLRETYWEEQKNSVKQVHSWTETQKLSVSNEIYVKILSLQSNNTFKICSCKSRAIQQLLPANMEARSQ
jgi:hypothetical protein